MTMIRIHKGSSWTMSMIVRYNIALLLLLPSLSTEAAAFTIPFTTKSGAIDHSFHHHSSRSTPTTLRLAASSSTSETTSVWTQEQLEDYADRQGVVLSLKTLGPGYRAIARAKHNTTQILGYMEGFVRPTGNLLHVDKMEVFRKMVKTARQENPDEFKGGGTTLGVGLLMAYLCLLYAQEQKCRTAEFLAIDDEEFQHKRLVRLYKQAGFQFIKYVGDDFSDIPDRMVWGGCGTLLRQDIPILLKFWTSLMEKSEQQ